MATQTTATSESVAKSNAALARYMATVPSPAAAPVNTETKTKAEQKAARLAEQDKVLAAKQPLPTKVVPALPPRKPAKKATKATALAKQGDTAKGCGEGDRCLGHSRADRSQGRQQAHREQGSCQEDLDCCDPVGWHRLLEGSLKTPTKAAKKPSMVLGTPASPTKVAKAVAEVKAAAVVPAKKPNVQGRHPRSLLQQPRPPVEHDGDRANSPAPARRDE